MTRLIPLILLALAACDAPLEQLMPRHGASFERDGLTYLVRSQYDPFEQAWATRISILHLRLGEEDRETAAAVMAEDFGPTVCEGRKMKVVEGREANLHMPVNGVWQFLGHCT